MKASRRTRQPAVLSQAPSTEECDSVIELLRQFAGLDEIRHRIMSTLAVDDLWCIWRGTKHASTERDQRTNQIATRELERRGLLLPTEQPQSATD
jgi:hypothetical protein